VSWQDDLRARQERVHEFLRYSEILVRRESVAQGQVYAINRECRAIEKNVGLAKARNLLKDDAKNVLDTLRQRVHHRTVGQYEQLLTALMSEVLPEQSKDRAISITLSEVRDKTSMDFNVLRSDGALESIYDGNGGALTNVVSAGLRLIALHKAKLTLRQFLVFDEPDCWIAPSRVPDFYRVLSEASRSLGIQMVAIAHHDSSVFKEFDAHFVRLSPSENGISVDNDSTQWENGQTGIRSIRLQNYRSHIDSFITLGPEVTVITGVNNLGKSAVIDALRAICYGEAGDDVIRHGENVAEVDIDLGVNHLVWKRNRKGNPKEVYQLVAYDGTLIREENKSRGAAPEWVEAIDVMGIGIVDNLDIQIAHQKKPVFLLDLKPSERTGILSVGRESIWVDRMIASYGKINKDDRQTIRLGEERLTKLKEKLGRIDDLFEPIKVQSMPDVVRASFNEIAVEKGLREDIEHLSISMRHHAICLDNVMRPVSMHIPDDRGIYRVRISLGESKHKVDATSACLQYINAPVPPVLETVSVDDAKNLSKAFMPCTLECLPDLPINPSSIQHVQTLNALKSDAKILLHASRTTHASAIPALPAMHAMLPLHAIDFSLLRKTYRIKILDRLPDLPVNPSSIQHVQMLDVLKSDAKALIRASRTIHVNAIPRLPVISVMQSLHVIDLALLRKTYRIQAIEPLPSISAKLSDKHAFDVEILKNDLMALKNSLHILCCGAIPATPSSDIKDNVSDLLVMKSSLFNALQHKKEQENEVRNLAIEMDVVLNELSDLKEQAGGICPLCYQPFNEKSHANH